MSELPLRSSVTRGLQSRNSSSRWFYEVRGQVTGPLNFRDLRQAALSSKFEGEHQVWKEGSQNKQAASTIVGLIPKTKEDLEQPASDVSDENPYAPPKARTIADGPPGGLYLPHLRHSSFLLFLTLFVVAVAFFGLGWKVSTLESRPIFFSLAGFAFGGWIILAVIFLHRAWDMMRMFGAPFTGTKAVRFLFIPIFNALWCFVVLLGWSRLWNHSVSTHPGLSLASKVWRPSFFIFPVLFLIGQTLVVMHLITGEYPTNLAEPRHQISLGLIALTFLFALVCWFQLTTAINFLARKKS